MLSLLFSVSLAAVAPSSDVATAESSVDSAPAELAPRPTVHLVVDGALREWLVVRLLEDGYPLAAAPGPAQVQLVVLPSDDKWSVTAIGASTVSFEVEHAADPAVMRLELLHRSVDALEDVVPREPPESGSDPGSVTVGLSVAEGAPEGLGPRIATDVLATGATLVPRDAAARLRVCAEQMGDEPRIVVIEGDTPCGSTDAVPFEPAAVDEPTLAQRVEGAVASLSSVTPEPPEEPLVEEPVAEEPEPEPETDPELPPGLEPPSAPARITTPLRGAPYVLRGGANVGVLARPNPIDAVVTASMTIGREPGMQAWLDVQVVPATVVGPLKVVEVVPAVGFQVRPLTIRRFSLLAGALLGGDIHSYRLDAGTLSSQGVHASASLEAALGAAYAVWRLHEMQALLRVGTSTPRVHAVEGEPVWQRGGLRISAMVGFTFGRRLGK